MHDPGFDRSKGSIQTQLSNAISDLSNAQDMLAKAEVARARASKEETDAINRVNGHQKRIDELVGMLKAQAPRSSGWRRPKSGEDCA